MLCPRCGKTLCNCLLEDPSFLARAVGKQLALLQGCGAQGLSTKKSGIAAPGTGDGDDSCADGQPATAPCRSARLPELTDDERQRRERATTLIHGDAVEILKGLPSGIADVCLFDPPYPCIKRPYGTMSEEKWHELMESVLLECHRVLKPNGSVVVVIQPNYQQVGRMRLWPWEFVCRASRMWDDWGLVQDVYSFAPNALPSAGVQRDIGLLRVSVKWCVWLGRADCYRDQGAVLQEPSDRTLRRYTDDRFETYPSGAKIRHETFRRAIQERGGVTPYNMLTVPTGTPIDHHGHPAITPYRLAEFWCRYVLPPGGCLIDPFCGSGTSLVAALDCMASKVIGIDKEESYLEKARCRILGTPESDAADASSPRDVSPYSPIIRGCSAISIT